MKMYRGAATAEKCCYKYSGSVRPSTMCSCLFSMGNSQLYCSKNPGLSYLYDESGLVRSLLTHLRIVVTQ